MALIDDLRVAYDEQLRGAERTFHPGVRFEQHGPLRRTVSRTPALISAPVDLGVYGTELDALIAREQAYFAARRQPVEWEVCTHDQPADLPERLVRAGFQPQPPDAVMIGVVAELSSVSPPLPDGVTVRRVSERADLERIAGLCAVVWNQPWNSFADDLADLVADAPDDVQILVAESDGVLVSTATLLMRTGTDFASTRQGATLREWRGKGLYSALVARRVEFVRERGAKYLHTDAAPGSESALRRLGFHAVTTVTPYLWLPPR